MNMEGFKDSDNLAIPGLFVFYAIAFLQGMHAILGNVVIMAGVKLRGNLFEECQPEIGIFEILLS